MLRNRREECIGKGKRGGCGFAGLPARRHTKKAFPTVSGTAKGTVPAAAFAIGAGPAEPEENLRGLLAFLQGRLTVSPSGETVRSRIYRIGQA